MDAAEPSPTSSRLPYVWDYDIDAERFRRILSGSETLGRLDRDWAAVRLLEYASYREIRRLLTFHDLVGSWSRWRPRMRSESRRRAFDFLVTWLPANHPELLAPERSDG